MKKTKLILIMMALLFSSAATFAQDNEDDGTVKIVYQCDFPDVQRVHLMLNTLNNAVKYYDKQMIDFQIDVVAFGPCLQYFMKDFKDTGFVYMPYQDHGGPTGDGTRSRFKSLKLLGGDRISYFACKNTMDKKNVKESQIADDVEVVPGGLVKIVDDELKGFAYIKIQ